jgi:NAD(P)H-dependent FMN reductase
LLAVRLLAPPGVEVSLYRGLAALPHFNPDLDDEEAPAIPDAVLELRREVGKSDAILISSPEYAHGVPGSLKDALDWLVSCFEFPGKPVALLNTAPRASHAQAALAETLITMSARLVQPACVTLPLTGRALDGAAIAADPQLAAVLRGAIAGLVEAVASASAEHGLAGSAAP